MFRRVNRICHALNPGPVGWKKLTSNRILHKNSHNNNNNNSSQQGHLSLKYYAGNLVTTRWHSILLAPVSSSISTRSTEESARPLDADTTLELSEDINSNSEEENDSYHTFQDNTLGYRFNARFLYLRAWRLRRTTPSFLGILLWKYHRDGSCPEHLKRHSFYQSLLAQQHRFNNFPVLLSGEAKSDLLFLNQSSVDRTFLSIPSTTSQKTLDFNRSYVDLDELEEKNNDHILLSLKHDLSATKNVVLVDLEAGTYHGSISNGVQNGNGLMVYTNGDCYEGEWKDGYMHGYGKMRYESESGGLYEGAWVRGERSGYGIYISKTGDRYVGYWLKNERHGNGRLFLGDELIYNGEWNCGDREGNGIAVFADKSIYTGEWQHGLMHGSGTFIHSIDGYQWDGQWSEGVFVEGKTSTISNSAIVERISNNRKEIYENGQLMSWHAYPENSLSKNTTNTESITNLLNEIKQFQSQINDRLSMAESLINS